MLNKGFGSMMEHQSKPLFHQNRVTRGKFKGKDYDWLLEHNPGFIVWASEKLTDHGLTQTQIKVAKLVKEQHDEQKKEDRYVRTAGTSYEDFWGGEGYNDPDNNADCEGHKD